MKFSELPGTYEKRRVICYNSNQTKALYHNKEVKHLAENLYIGKPNPGDYNVTWYDVYTFFPGADVGMWIFSYDSVDYLDFETSLERIQNSAAYNLVDTQENFISKVKAFIARKDKAYLRFTEIELLKHVAPELVADAEKAKDAFTEERERKAKEREEKRREEDEAYCREQNAEAQKAIDEALEVIKNDGTLVNREIVLYNSRYDYKKTCTVAYLMREYGVNVPIRTMGFINNNLVNVIVENGKTKTYRYQKSGKSKGSNAVFDSLEELYTRVRAQSAEEAV